MASTRRYSDFRGFLKVLEDAGNLVHVREELSTRWEIAAAMDHLARHKETAVIFDRVKGYDIPVAGNLFVSGKNLAIAFGVGEEEVEETYLKRAEDRLKPMIVEKGAVQDVVIDRDVDILRHIPVLTYHEKDAGPYISSAVTIARDPVTGMRGMGVHRIQIKSKDTLGIFLANPPLAHFLAKSEAMGKPLEIAVVTGVDPLCFCAAVFPAVGVDKFDIAGGFRHAPVSLVKCRTVDLEVPADAEFVLEGRITPGVREKEGPFGESTGYYFTFESPVAKITALTSRAQPIYDGLVTFGGEGQALFEIMMRPHLLKSLRQALPDVGVRNLTSLGIHGLCVVQIDKKREEDAGRIIDHLLTFTRTKTVVVVDEDIHLSDMSEIVWAMVTRLRPHEGLTVKLDLLGTAIDPSSAKLEKDELGRLGGRSSKLGIDATRPLKDSASFERVGFPADVNEKIRKLMETMK